MSTSIITREAYQLPDDIGSGARVTRLTSFPCVNMNIYCEVPYMDAASKYLFFLRQMAPGRPSELWRANLENKRLEMIDERLPSVGGAAISPDQTTFYYYRADDEGLTLVQMDAESLERIERKLPAKFRPKGLGSVTPDRAGYIINTESGNGWAIVRVELATGEIATLYKGTNISNAHVQVDPRDGRRVLVQINELQSNGDPGVSTHLRSSRIGLGLLDIASGQLEELAIGPPFTEVNCQGHQCFIGMTGRVLATLSEIGGGASEEEILVRRKRNIEEGNLVSIGSGEKSHTVVARGHRFAHPNASRDGRFFVADTSEGKLVAGSVATGRHRVLCDSGTSFGGAQYCHAHPYFSPDCRWVVFNSNATGVPHLYVAEVPDGFLAELE